MAEYIEREAAKECVKEHYDDAIIIALGKIPAADVRPVAKGRWKLATYSGKFGNAKGKWYDQFLDGAFWYCDQCRERARKSNFCPNCGARMEES